MIRIVTDSASDLPPEIAAALHVAVVPLTVRFGKTVYLDGVDLTSHEFWERLAASDRLPETAAPSVSAFVDVFEGLANEGASGIVVVCLSSAVSATYQTAVLAAERVDEAIDVRVVDSQAVSMALGLQVTAAAAVAAGGAGIEDVVLTATNAATKTNVFAAVDTLKYLRRGGRVGKAASFFGRLLKVKPLIHFEDGAVASAGQVWTRAKAITAIVEKAVELSDRLEGLAVVHSSSDDVDDLLGRLRVELPAHSPIVAELGPVVGTHAGPGAIGIAYRLI